jgi:hypothetical protein
MAATETLMVVSTLEETQVGQVYDSMPTHVTNLAWFNLATDSWEYFNDEMHDLIEQTRQPSVIIGDRGFEDDPGAPVYRLNRITPTFNVLRGFDIHAGVWRAAHQFGQDIDPTYAGLNWHPHISDKTDSSLQTGQEIILDNLTVFRRDEQRKKIVKAIYRWDAIHD